jgi:hypothetical protein
MSIRDVSFDGRKVSVEFHDEAVAELLEFLFLDLGSDDSLESAETFVVSRQEEKNLWKLTRNEKSLFKGENLAGLGTILMGEVLFHLITDNCTGLAIHAGLVSNETSTTLIPGTSGSGKSSVTTWMLCNGGMRYHTDELVTINLETHQVKAFTRPLNIKTRGLSALKSLVDLDTIEEHLQVSAGVTMIPHRLVNPEYHPDPTPITHLIFPKYIADSESEIVKLSGAEAGLEMMRSNVIARNLPSHGFSQIIALVRNTPAYRIHYRQYDDLAALIEQVY